MASSAIAQFITQEQDEEFDYDLVQSKYFQVCREHFKKPLYVTGPWTQQEKKFIIGLIKGDAVSEKNYNLKQNYMLLYQVAVEDGEEKIVLKNTAIELLTFEECFDIFVELHRKSNHGNTALIKAMLEDNFIVNATCLTFFVANCNVCNKYKQYHVLTESHRKGFNDRIVIDIMRMPVKDDDCEFILFYYDERSTFLLLRPLITMEECELCVEMFKIFTDFGPPLAIETKHINLFSNVLSTLSRAGLKYTIFLHKTDNVIAEEIIKSVIPVSTNWATYCRFSQFKHNSLFLQAKVVGPEHEKSIKKRAKNKKPHRKPPSTDENDVILNPTEVIMLDSQSDEEQIGKNIPSIDTDSDSNMDIGIDVNQTIDAMEYVDSNQIHDSENDSENDFEHQAETITAYNTNIYIKEELTIEETKIIGGNDSKMNPSSSKLCEISKSSKDSGDITKGDITETQSSVMRKESITEIIKEGAIKQTKLCSNCQGKMLTDYFCFLCKKDTHIFCMTRVTNPINCRDDPLHLNVTSFTYCESCIKKKDLHKDE